MTEVDSDVLILGGGVIGLGCALGLPRAGRSVTVLDGGAVGSGSSRGNCGTITPSHLPLHAPGTVGRALRWMLTRDAPFYVRPTLDPQLLVWLLRFARRCNPRDFRATAQYKSKLLLESRRQLAALIARERLEHTRVQGFDARGGRIGAVATACGPVRAREVVLALGAWSAPLARQIGLRLPIQPGKGYSITYARPRCAPAIPLVLEERSVCVTAWGSGYRLGSTMEFSGFDSTLNAARLAALRRGAAEYLEEPEGPVMEEQWYGWRPMTYDDLPIIGRAQRFANLTLATGHGMLGMSLAAVTAQLVTDLLISRTACMDMAPLSPWRFGA